MTKMMLEMPTAHNHGNCELCDWLGARIEALEQDGRRMDYLEGEELSRGDALFRQNCPITRAFVDAALAEEKKP